MSKQLKKQLIDDMADLPPHHQMPVTKGEMISQAIKDSAPAFFGYVPLGIAFGILSVKTLGNFWFGPLMSLLVYAGAAQYLSLGIIAAKGSMMDLALTTFVVNLRHIFYGIPFLNVFKGSFLKRLYLIFGITDETYSILTATHHPLTETYTFWVTWLTHAYWVGGTIMGSVLGALLAFDLSALDFSLTALFVILTIEQAYKNPHWSPFLIGTGAFCLALLLPDSFFLSGCMAIATVMTSIHYLSRREACKQAH